MLLEYFCEVSGYSIIGGFVIFGLTFYSFLKEYFKKKSGKLKLLEISLPVIASFFIVFGNWIDYSKYEKIKEERDKLFALKIDTTIRISYDLYFMSDMLLGKTDSSRIENKSFHYIADLNNKYFRKKLDSNHFLNKEIFNTLNKITDLDSSFLIQEIAKLEQKYSSNSGLTLNDYIKITFNGTIVENYGQSISKINSSTEYHYAFNEMTNLLRNKNFEELINKAENYQSKYNNWFTPSYYKVLALLSKDFEKNKNEATKLITYIIEVSKKDPEYLVPISDLYKNLNQIETAKYVLSLIDKDKLEKYENTTKLSTGFNSVLNGLSNYKSNKK